MVSWHEMTILYKISEQFLLDGCPLTEMVLVHPL